MNSQSDMVSLLDKRGRERSPDQGGSVQIASQPDYGGYISSQRSLRSERHKKGALAHVELLDQQKNKREQK